MIPVFAIYQNPRDYPGRYVVHRWLGLEPDREPWAVTDTVEEARAALPQGLHCLPRQPDEDPAILETWF